MIAILISAAGGYYFLKPDAVSQTQTVYTYGAVETGAIMQTVSGTGQVSPARETALKSKTAGKILEVAVVAGQSVKAQDVIARIDDDDAQDAVYDARAALESAQIALDELYDPVDDLTLTQAENALVQAKESLASDQDDLAQSYKQGFTSAASAFSGLSAIISGLQDIVAGASSYVTQSNPTYLDYYADAIKDYDSQASLLVAQSAAAWRQTKDQYDRNFTDYKKTSRESSNEEIENLINQTYETAKLAQEALKNTTTLIQRYKDVMESQNLTAQTFSETHLSSLSSYTTQNNSNLSNLLSAKQAIADAESTAINAERTLDEKTKSLDKLKQAPDESDIKSKTLAVEQKQRALDAAREALADCIITAPFDGVVAAIDIKTGDEISSGASVATIITGNQVASITLNEVDIAKVEAGQKAALSFSAVDGLTITGKVAQVGVMGSVSQGVVSYEVVIALDEVNPQVKSGMSVSAAVITQIKQNVLLVPSTAVKTANDGSAYVLMESSGEGADAVPREQAVSIGLSDDQNTEIISGINEGDRVAVSSSKQSAAASSSPAQTGGSMFNIGGMGAPMR
ncbi:MAG TPA: efflux RND transporter periplasmic adaptor subunit [Candidatus Pacearchaeota archaeon]|nr:efflux RND transporter periplasmic adaptor subunit [Candidatus Pacearchaeota archaeon]